MEQSPVQPSLPAYEAGCYLCPGNGRMGGTVNPQYEDTMVFTNDFPALLPDALPEEAEGAGQGEGKTSGSTGRAASLFTSEPVRGRCAVLCLSPRHDLTLARMPPDAIARVVHMWQEVYEAEGRVVGPNGYVQIFENRGAMMGASAPHPHMQVWSVSYVPDEPARELANLAAYAAEHGGVSGGDNGDGAPRRGDGAPCMLCDYAHAEVTRRERVVALDEDGGWVAVVPYWATWPYEVLLLPYKRHITSVAELRPDETDGLARILKDVLVRYDNLFACPFPYSMGLHQAPFAPSLGPGVNACPAHIHIHFYPPLLRSSTVRKFLVGFEMLAEAQRDLTPEAAAAKLRDAGGPHYLDK